MTKKTSSLQDRIRSAYQTVSRKLKSPFERPDPLAPGDHSVIIDGLKFHYRVAGQGPVAILPTPGWGIGGDYLAGLEQLKKHFTLVFFDTRGSGQSERPDSSERLEVADWDPYNFWRLVTDLQLFRKSLGVEKVTMIGHSMGTMQAMVYAACFPKNTRSLLLIGATPFSHDKKFEEAREKALDRVRAEPWFNEALQAIEASHQAKTDDAFRAALSIAAPFYFYDNNDIEKNRALFARQSFNAAARRALNTAPWLKPSLLADIQAPTLIINGCEDLACLPLDAERVHRWIPGSKLVMVDRAGHMPWMERPDVFFDAVEKEIPYLLPLEKEGKKKDCKPAKK